MEEEEEAVADVDCCLAVGRREAAERLRGEMREDVAVDVEDGEYGGEVTDTVARGARAEAEE
jgi:hypothetical protein